MGKTLYLECKSGISGDMTVASLLDLGANKEELMAVLNGLGVEGFEVKIGRIQKQSIEACRFDVVLKDQPNDQHSDHEHHHEHHHGHAHHHGPDDHHHKHEHHSHSHGEHVHRNITDVFAIIDKSGLRARAKQLAKSIFTIVAEAESKAHGLPVDQIHFHEVGAVDSIVDIIAAAFCLDDLDISEVVISSLSEGCGEVYCQHGLLPVPVPAVLNIVSAHGLPLTITENKSEMITPTGAAIAAAIKTRDKLPEQFTIHRVGLGAGQKDFDRPNILRAMIIEEESPVSVDGIWSLEVNIDDCTGEALAYALEQLFAGGAKDAFFTPIYMKKNRPAYLLRVLCDADSIKAMESIIFTHTTTIGVRKSFLERSCLTREILNLESEYGPVQVKKVVFEGRERFYPEYESVKSVCQASGLPFQNVYSLIQALAESSGKQA